MYGKSGLHGDGGGRHRHGVEATAVSSAEAAAVLRAKNQTFMSGKAAVAPPLAAGELSVSGMHSSKRTSRADPLKPDQ